MSKPVGSNPFNGLTQSTQVNNPVPPAKTQCFFASLFKDLEEGLNKATTPCEVYCKEKWEANPEIKRIEDYMQSCIRDCKSFQARLP